VATAAKNTSIKSSNHPADLAAARQSGKLVFWLILAVLGLGFVTVALS